MKKASTTTRSLIRSISSAVLRVHRREREREEQRKSEIEVCLSEHIVVVWPTPLTDPLQCFRCFCVWFIFKTPKAKNNTLVAKKKKKTIHSLLHTHTRGKYIDFVEGMAANLQASRWGRAEACTAASWPSAHAPNGLLATRSSPVYRPIVHFTVNQIINHAMPYHWWGACLELVGIHYLLRGQACTTRSGLHWPLIHDPICVQGKLIDKRECLMEGNVWQEGRGKKYVPGPFLVG